METHRGKNWDLTWNFCHFPEVLTDTDPMKSTKTNTSFGVSTSESGDGWVSGSIRPLTVKCDRLWRRKKYEYTDISLFPSHLGLAKAPSLLCSAIESLRTPLNEWAVIFSTTFPATAVPKISNKPVSGLGFHLHSPEDMVLLTEQTFNFSLNYLHIMLFCSPVFFITLSSAVWKAMVEQVSNPVCLVTIIRIKKNEI